MVKEKMYNFGELGKWSESTLKAQKTLDEGFTIIETLYYKKDKEFMDEMDRYGDIKIKKLTIKNMVSNVEEFLKVRDKHKKLEKDYDKFWEVINGLSKKKKSKK